MVPFGTLGYFYSLKCTLCHDGVAVTIFPTPKNTVKLFYIMVK